MPLYRVTYKRRAVQYGYVDVEAEDADAAQLKADHMDDSHVDWDDPVPCEHSVGEPHAVEEAPRHASMSYDQMLAYIESMSGITTSRERNVIPDLNRIAADLVEATDSEAPSAAAQAACLHMHLPNLLACVEKMTTLRPMSEAPRDGTEVVLVWASDGTRAAGRLLVRDIWETRWGRFSSSYFRGWLPLPEVRA